MADPGADRYRFEAEVRQDNAEGDSQVGLFYGYRQTGPPGADCQCAYGTLEFADRGRQAWFVNPGKEPEPVSRVRPCVHLRRGGEDHRSSAGKEPPFDPLPFMTRGPGVWRKLAVEVSPQGVTAFWWHVPEGRWQRVDHLPAARLEKRLNYLRQKHPDMAGVPGDFRPRLGLGLYIFQGKASFRRIALVPARDP